MPSSSRRTLLAAAATALAASPAFAAGIEGDGGGLLVLASRTAATRETIPAATEAVYCGGYERAGDRGEALYARVSAEPANAGKFRSADGAWWELAESTLNPFMFGAKARGRTDDAPAIQAMFDFVAVRKTAYPMAFLGARYWIGEGLILPTIPQFVTLDIDGGGAVLITDAPIAIFSRVPTSQHEASITINGSHYDIHHFEFQGSGREGQIGLHIGASYCNVVRNCTFSFLQYGSIGTFCLCSSWRDNLYNACSTRALTIQTGAGYDQGEVWPGSTESNSPCHINVIENCRVAGHPNQKSAFGIFGCDGVRVLSCISEGRGGGIDLHFDFRGSTTVKLFHVDTFHCESPQSVLNFKIRSAGKVRLDRLIRSYPQAFLDSQGSVNCEIVMSNLSYLGNIPEATGSGPNPNGRLFYHAQGNGFGAKTEHAQSSGVGFRFEECVEDAWKLFTDPKRWEGGELPFMLHVRGLRSANNGMMEWSNAPIQFASPITFGDNSMLSGIKVGTVVTKTAEVPARTSATERIAVAGLVGGKHVVTVNPANSVSIPPPGVSWNAYVETDGVLAIRLTNATEAPVKLQPNALWAYSAPRGQ